MRIIAGSFKGRSIDAPKGTGTRPTSDRVREALFSRIDALAPGVLDGAVVLDAFAGSGALGIEALSRGAARVLFVERDRGAVAAIARNIDAFAIAQRARVIPRDVTRAGPAMRSAGPFTLLFLDPPYRIDKSEVRGLIAALASAGAISRGALVVWEHAAGDAAEWPEGFVSAGTRKYGSTEVDVATYGVEEEGIQ